LGGRDFDAEHQRIVDAALSRDAEAAIAFTVDHFVETTRIILSGESDQHSAARTIEALRRDIGAGIGSPASR
jgi:DNA-binding GntR family transcriptional regulator